jgi:hypothetical protein
VRNLVAFVGLAATCSFALGVTKPDVTKAFADNNGRVRIVTGDGRDRLIPPEKGQDGVDSIQVAPDGLTVAWVVKTSESCCVSYPLPTELVIWRSGRILRRVHPLRPIWGWAFQNNGAQIAYRASFPHGGWSGEYVLMDTATGKTLGSWDHPVNENGNDTDDAPNEPEWAKLVP